MLVKLWHHLSKRRQKQFVFVQIFILIGSFFEMISLGAVVPFLSVLSKPESVYENKYVQPFVKFFEITNVSQIELYITILFISLVILSAIVRSSLHYLLIRLSFLTGGELSVKIYRHTLYQDYSIHVARNSSEVINGIITKTSTVTKGVISPVLALINASITIVGIISVLLLMDITVTLSVFLGFGGFYLIIMQFTRGLLKKNSQLIADKSDLMVKSLQEGLESIREVLINNNQNFYLELYRNSDLQMRHASRRNEFIVASPRFLMEAIGIVLIAIFAFTATKKLGGIDQFLPILGVFVLGAQKLLPAIQKGYAAYSRIKGSKYSLIDVINLLDQPIPDHINLSLQTPTPFNKLIELKNLSFRYSEDSPWILKNINLKIPKGSIIGIVGATGCGKSTLIDVIMGLLLPTSGELRVDNQIITSNNKIAWQAYISNVPQHIYLSDSTIEKNIAFGIANEKIDYQRVQKAAQQAQIAELVEGWEKGYQTLVGERGTRLSGGQRQRVGIARAFYKELDVLIFDEATSALDDETELAVMNEIEKFDRDITVFMIAHRLTTLKNCDIILKFEKNYATKTLSYDDLMNSNKNKDDI